MSIDVAYLLLVIAIAAFFGSWHCAVMCGPIAVAMGQRGRVWHYHAGRAISYVGAGAMAGGLGGIFFRMGSLQERIAGAVILSSLFAINFLPKRWRLKIRLNFLVHGKARPSAFIFGLSSVFLPCGWLWTFIAAAGASHSPWAGALITCILWASSLPALSLLTFYFRNGSKRMPDRQQYWINAVLSFSGIYAIWSHFVFH